MADRRLPHNPFPCCILFLPLLCSALAGAHGAGGARAQGDVAVHGGEGVAGVVLRVGGVDNAPAAGPGVVGRARGGVAAEVLAVVPGGASVAVHVGGIGDDAAAEDDDGEVLELADVLELRTRWPSATRKSSAPAHQRSGINAARAPINSRPAPGRSFVWSEGGPGFGGSCSSFDCRTPCRLPQQAA